MATYRALCIYQGKGRPSVQVVEAASPEAAVQALTAAGWVVGKVEEIAATSAVSSAAPSAGPAGIPPVPPQRYQQAPAGGSWLRDFFAFRVMVLPTLVRVGFILYTVISVIGTLVVFVGVAFDLSRSSGGPPPRLSVVASLIALAWIWGVWLVWRVMAEFLIVVFSINDRARDITRNTARLAGNVRPPACARCGYDLRGLDQEASVCPECGERW